MLAVRAVSAVEKGSMIDGLSLLWIDRSRGR
jgi:hypothetical protein